MRDRIEAGFENWGRFVLRHPWSIIAIMMLFSAFFIYQTRDITIEANTESFLKKGDPARITYNEFRQEFGTDEMVILVMQADDLFDPEFLGRLRALHFDIEENLPYATDVRSLVNARVTHGTEDTLITDDLMKDWPRGLAQPPDPALLEEIRAEALSNPLYENLWVSKDRHYTSITALLEPGDAILDEDALAAFDDTNSVGHVVDSNVLLDSDEIDRVALALFEIVGRHEAADFHIWTAGLPPLTYEVIRTMQKDMVLFTGFALVFIAILLLLLFHRIAGILLPLITVVLPLITTFGCMATIGIPISPATQIMPSFLLAVGIANAVHLLAIFFREIDQGKNRDEALIFALGHSGLAIAMASITTAGSLVSFVFAELAPLAGFGAAAPIGVMLALLYSIVLLPALLAVVPVKRRTAGLAGKVGHLDRVLATFGDVSTKYPGRVVVVWLLLIAVASSGVAQLRLSHNSAEWFKPGHPLREAMEVASDKLGTSMTLEIIVDTGEENGTHDPEMMNRIDAIRAYAQDLVVGEVKVGKAIAVSDILKETHEALNADDPSFYAIPQDRNTIAQELLLFESSGSDDLDDVVTSQFDKARITLTIPFRDAQAYVGFQDDLMAKTDEIMGDRADIKLTGFMSLTLRTINAMLTSMMRSYLIALLIITPIMVLLIGELRLGLLCMIPNLAPIIISLGIMHYLGFPLDMFTMLIGSIAIGVAVDDTIHFMHNFRRYYDQGCLPQEAVHKTLLSTGRAMLITSIVLAVGFFVFIGSSMVNIINFGIITGITVISAFLADVVLSPALVMLATRNKARAVQPEAREPATEPS